MLKAERSFKPVTERLLNQKTRLIAAFIACAFWFITCLESSPFP